MLLGAVLVSWLPAVAGAQIAGESPELEHALARMDTAAKNFKTTEASVVWEQYQKVIDEKRRRRARFIFGARRRNPNGGGFCRPAKYVLYGGGQVQVYQPKIDQVSKYEAARTAATWRAFWCLASGRRPRFVQFLRGEVSGDGDGGRRRG